MSRGHRRKYICRRCRRVSKQIKRKRYSRIRPKRRNQIVERQVEKDVDLDFDFDFDLDD